MATHFHWMYNWSLVHQPTNRNIGFMKNITLLVAPAPASVFVLKYYPQILSVVVLFSMFFTLAVYPALFLSLFFFESFSVGLCCLMWQQNYREQMNEVCLSKLKTKQQKRSSPGHRSESRNRSVANLVFSSNSCYIDVAPVNPVIVASLYVSKLPVWWSSCKKSCFGSCGDVYLSGCVIFLISISTQ